MKKQLLAVTICVLITASLVGCSKKSINTNKEISTPASAETNPSIKYKDGTYKAKTDADTEGFYEKASVTIENRKIVKVDWGIYDGNRSDRPFDEKYEEVYAGNEEYVNQCRMDWKGSRGYGPKLIKTQDIDKVDTVSGATWTNKKFKEVVKIALEDAEK